MEWVLVALATLIVTITLVASHFIDTSNPYPFKKKNQLFTSVERSFFVLLDRAVGNDYKIVNRVRLNDIIETKETVKGRSKRSASLKAQNKLIDYVLCDPKDFRIIAAVDLVNQTQGGHKSKADWFVTGALEAAGIPHIRIKVKSGYKVEEIRNGILYKIGKKERAYPPQPIIKGNIPRRPVGALSAGQVKAQISSLPLPKAS